VSRSGSGFKNKPGTRHAAYLKLTVGILNRVSNPDPHGSRSRRQKLPTKKEKSKEISCFEVLDVPF